MTSSQRIEITQSGGHRSRVELVGVVRAVHLLQPTQALGELGIERGGNHVQQLAVAPKAAAVLRRTRPARPARQITIPAGSL